MLLKFGEIHLRALSPTDANAMYKLAESSDAHLFTTPFWRPWSVDDFQDFVTEVKTSSERLKLGVCLSDGDRLIGVVELHKLNWVHGNAEVGIVIWPAEARGKGYGTQALKALCNWAFNTLRLRRLYAKTFASNSAARRSFEKVGFSAEGTWREHFFVNGRAEDACLYGLLKEEHSELLK